MINVFIWIFLVLCLVPPKAIRFICREVPCQGNYGMVSKAAIHMPFREASNYQNGVECPTIARKNSLLLSCHPLLVHIAMTLDPDYLRGTIAAIHSVLKHTSCPDNILFHLITSDSEVGSSTYELHKILTSAFPSLKFKEYLFEEKLLTSYISYSVREALDNPQNYARIYLADILGPCVKRVIYLDSEVIAVDDIQKLRDISLTHSRTIGAPKYCHANSTKYFSDEFWSDSQLLRIFAGKKACYFNTGVMVMDLVRWRNDKYGVDENPEREEDLRVGSLPPFLLVFGGDVEAIGHILNQHGLGGDNVVSSCRALHPGPVSLLHWSGKGKPWKRLDRKSPCAVDALWAPYDLCEDPINCHVYQEQNFEK